MTLKPGTNLGELNHLPKKTVLSFGIAKLWAGCVPGLVSHGADPTGIPLQYL